MSDLLAPPQVLPSNEKLRFAEPHVIDFAWLKENRDGNRSQDLNGVLADASLTGLLHVTNHGLSPDLFETLRAITYTYMMTTSLEEKDEATTKEGSDCFEGYKKRTDAEIEKGLLPPVEEYNYDYRNGQSQIRPKALRENENVTKKIFDFYHRELTPLLLDAINDFLELPKGTLRQCHQNSSEIAHLLFYRPHWYKDDVKKRAMYAGHTDIGSLTYLYANPIASLQVYGPNGWEYVAYIPNSIVVNMGDAMQFLSRGKINATLHRVIKPRSEYDGVPRTAIVYFVHPDHESMCSSVRTFQELRATYTEQTKASPGSLINASGLNRVISTVSALRDDMYFMPVNQSAWMASRMGQLVASPKNFLVDYEALAVRPIAS